MSKATPTLLLALNKSDSGFDLATNITMIGVKLTVSSRSGGCAIVLLYVCHGWSPLDCCECLVGH